MVSAKVVLFLKNIQGWNISVVCGVAVKEATGLTILTITVYTIYFILPPLQKGSKSVFIYQGDFCLRGPMQNRGQNNSLLLV
ncbi:MAG: hypothetical protein SGJ10_05360, partial [Bacteroidota bacterium]|nr:hypothetical protein [Bacteroidota bacterium]